MVTSRHKRKRTSWLLQRLVLVYYYTHVQQLNKSKFVFNMCSLPKKLKLAIVAYVEDEISQTPIQTTQFFASIVHFCSNAKTLYFYAALLPFFRENHVRIPDFYETWIPLYLNCDFFNHFRMGRPTFQKLLQEVGCSIGDKLNNSCFGGRTPVRLEKGLLITLWYVAKGDSILSVSDRFNVSKSTVSVTTTKCINWINQLCPKYVCWPKREECAEIAEEFKEKSKYPDVIGAIDGCHIPLKVPADQQDSYLNRKFFHSINLQGICTARRIFTNVFIGFPGSAHDARVLRYSAIYRRVERYGVQSKFYDGYHLVGDSAYPCQTWLMTPYKDTGKLSNSQKAHNQALSRARVCV